jgi:nitrile hydratase
MEYNMATSNQNAPTILRVVANTPTVHNVIVCTLCSCYPIGLLGFSPAWYKSRAYRSRVVREPRKVLQEFGLTVPETTMVRVHDSTADCRYFVLPLPPAHLSEQDIQTMSHAELKALITRDSMIGVAVL